MSRVIRGSVVAVCLGVVSACTIKSETSVSDSGTAASVKVSMSGASTTEAPLAPGDVRIKSTDGVLVLSLVGDTVRMQLSDSLRNSVDAEIRKDGDTSSDKSGIAAMVTKSVAGVVKSALGFTVKAAAKDVENLRYEDGHIRFDVHGGKGNVNINSNGRNDSNNAKFSEADAKKFIDAVKKKAANAIAM